jgi:hypothetical protein
MHSWRLECKDILLIFTFTIWYWDVFSLFVIILISTKCFSLIYLSSWWGWIKFREKRELPYSKACLKWIDQSQELTQRTKTSSTLYMIRRINLPGMHASADMLPFPPNAAKHINQRNYGCWIKNQSTFFSPKQKRSMTQNHVLIFFWVSDEQEKLKQFYR